MPIGIIIPASRLSAGLSDAHTTITTTPATAAAGVRQPASTEEAHLPSNRTEMTLDNPPVMCHSALLSVLASCKLTRAIVIENLQCVYRVSNISNKTLFIYLFIYWHVSFFIHIIGWRLSVSINDMLCYVMLCYIYQFIFRFMSLS